MSQEEMLAVYNNNNKFLKNEKRSIVHSKGLFHRTVNVLIINSEKKFLLQQRSTKKTICPLMWDISVAEHVKIGESYSKAAVRGLREELGIEGKIKEIRGVHLQKNTYLGGKIKDFEFVKSFGTLYNEKIKVNKKEVNYCRFFSISKINKKIAEDKNSFTPWFLNEWNYLVKSGKLNSNSSLLKH